MIKNYLNRKGQAAIVLVLSVLAVVVLIVTSIGFLTYNDLKTIGSVVDSSKSYYAAEAGIEDIIYRIAGNHTYSNSYTLTVGSASTQVDVSGPLSALVVTSKGNQSSRFRKLQIELGVSQTTTNIAFNYGVQVGYGGLVLNNNSGVNGNVYSNGPIDGGNNTFVTGTAISANSPASNADQTNDSPTTPTNSINFRNVSSSQDLGQSFQVSQSLPISKVQFYLRKSGNPSNATVRIVNNNGSNPGTTTVASGTLTSSSVTGTYGWIDVTMSSNPQLTAGVTYWVVIDNSSQSSSNYYTVGANNTYANGQAKVGQQAGTWNNTSPVGLDAYFKVFLGGTTGLINNVDIGTGSTGDARAHTVTNSSIVGNLYCQVGSGNNKACNTSQADPTPQSFPISDANIAEFKAQAEAGGTITGDYILSNNITTTLGPKKITGNMVLGNNIDLTITGTVYVQGTVTLSNNVDVRLDPAYGANGGILIADGFVNLGNNVTFQGSGQAGSYFLLISTNDCNGTNSPTGLSCTTANSAIELGNNVGSVIIYGSRGQVHVSNNGGAKEITGYKLVLDNNATVTYETGLANANFSSGPGGGFQINSWREVE